MSILVPHHALIVVADGVHAKFFRNTSHDDKPVLSSDGELKPHHLVGEGPAGKIPPDMSRQEIEEATFAKQLAQDLYRRVHGGQIPALVLIADPQTLGQIRPLLHKEVQARIVLEIAKTLTKATTADIQKALHA
jgi:protein required for attachment to host cells